MMETSNSQIPCVIRTDEAQHILPHEITLGAHHLLLKSDQSIELMHAGHDHTQPEYVLCLDAIETYRLMRCLCDLFQQPTNG
ncbi:MAG TPA: hypothetical protein VFU49_05365 [Ktedonobacteraceae bacterium]|nr:hypothetical protein [Ktedonobacteraceae bacterium]